MKDFYLALMLLSSVCNFMSYTFVDMYPFIHNGNFERSLDLDQVDRRFQQQEVNVRQYGAKGDGITDDTEAIQKAIDYARANKKSTVVFPNGRYRLSKKSIIVRQGILLKGIDKMPAKSGFGSDICQFEITFGKGNVKIPAFIVERFSGITGFSFLYPDQSPKAQQPILYGWTISTNGNESQDAVVLRNLMLTNSYLGIKLDNGGQHILENIFGQPFRIGIFIDRQYDVLTINNIHFWPFYTQPGQALYEWIQINGEAIVLNRTDGLQGNNWFAFGYQCGLHLSNIGNGSPWLTVNNLLIDVCRQPIVIDAVNYLTLNNVTLTGTNVAVAQQGILINESVNDASSNIQINGLTVVNCTNSLVNKGLCTIIASMKPKIYDGKNNGVRWFDVINENDNALLNITIPLHPGDEYRRVTGKMQLNGNFTYQSVLDITPNDFSAIYNWSGAKSRIIRVSEGSRFNLLGDIAVASYLLPSSVRTNPGLYILEMKIKVYSSTGQLGLAKFYPRLRDYVSGIDYSLTSYIADPYFLSSTTLKVPFVVNNSSVYIDFVFGNATDTKSAYMDVNSLKLYKAIGAQTGYIELMPKHQNYDRKQN